MLERIISFNYHPPFASFPFALLSIVVLLEIIQLFKSSDFLKNSVLLNLSLSVLAVIATFFSGYHAEDLFHSELPKETNAETDLRYELINQSIGLHHNLGRILLFCIVACYCLYFAYQFGKYNKQLFRTAYYLMLAAVYTLVLITGFLGGELVFQHSVGVAVHDIGK